MAKGYVLVDIPEECDKCLFMNYVEYPDGFLCHACYDEDGTKSKYLKRGLQLPKGFKPDWCPIKKFPKKKQWAKNLMGTSKVGMIV